MKAFLVANPKGGSGKSTLATNLGGYFANKGNEVMLGDFDRQQSSREWLGMRPFALPTIDTWAVGEDNISRPPKGTSHVVLDTPGGLHGKRFKEMVRVADKVIVPLQPSIFDIYATRAFLDELAEQRHAGRLKVGLVGMRVDARTRAAGAPTDGAGIRRGTVVPQRTEHEIVARPDQHVAARWRKFDAAQVRAAVARATCNA